MAINWSRGWNFEFFANPMASLGFDGLAMDGVPWPAFAGTPQSTAQRLGSEQDFELTAWGQWIQSVLKGLMDTPSSAWVRDFVASRKTQEGFTVIELVMVIVILSILAAMALPKFQNLSLGATRAELENLKSAAQTGAANHFVLYKSGFSAGFVVEDTNICTAASIRRFIDTPVPLNVLVAGSQHVSNCDPAVVGTGYTAACAMYMITDQGSVSVNFRVPCTR